MIAPNGRERKALQALSFAQWEHPASLPSAGAGTIKAMLEKGWIEMLPDTPSGLKRCKITQAGRDALAIPVVKPPARRPIKMLEPRLKPLDTRTVKPSR